VNRLGRGPESDIRVEDPGVSRAHCEIVLGTPAVLRDLGSTNGTLVDGQRVSQIALVDGSTVQVGSTTFVYRTA
jgi:pSer/pThr/pTyr-binding forkhead associated (FHA) protein